MRLIKGFKPTTSLAELIGIILGDGHMHSFPRTERFVITCGAAKSNYVKRIVGIITKIFGKKPSILKRKREETYDISLYQNDLCRRLEIPAGNKIKNNVGVPLWIKNNKKYMIPCLKGLFETDGCFQEDLANYAQYIELKNFCSQIRIDAHAMLTVLGYHPQLGKNYVRLARKKEVYSFLKLIKFREN